MSRYGWLILGVAALFAAGCATTMGAKKAAESDAMKSQVASLEDQMRALNQRVEEILRRQGLLESEVKSRAAAAPQTSAKSASATLSVREVQKALKVAGFYQGSIDGKIGSATKEALRSFQRDHGLTADGVCGRQTWLQLKAFA